MTDMKAPERTERATATEVAVLAGGCFWGVEELLRDVPGVLDTEVGYTGGWLENPTYHDTHDSRSGHAEAIRVVFDPAVLSYEELLERWFFRLHDPTTLNRQGNDVGTQYRSAIFPQSPEQREIAARVKGYTDRLDADLNVVIGKTRTDLDSRKEAVRTREASMGNLITDALREALKADAAITNGGGLRGDAFYPAGSDLRRRDFFAENPFGNVGVLVEMTGAALLSALENGVSKVEDKGGRFPQVSGIRFTYDPKLPAGTRVIEASVGGKPLDPAAVYRVATNDYLLRGGDGYDAFPKAKVIVDPSGAVLIATITMEYVAARGTVEPKVEGRIVARP